MSMPLAVTRSTLAFRLPPSSSPELLSPCLFRGYAFAEVKAHVEKDAFGSAAVSCPDRLHVDFSADMPEN